MLPSQAVNPTWLSQLELLDVNIYPLSGATVRRGSLPVDERLVLRDPKSSDLITFFEHVASVRHKPTMKIYVAFRETMDLLLMRQQDPVKFPKWLMEHPVKQTEIQVRIYEACNNPKKFAVVGTSEAWWDKWLKEITEDWKHDSLSYYLYQAGVLGQMGFQRSAA